MLKESTTISKTENVLIRAGDCKVSILPEFGGKIASIQIGDLEILQPQLATIAPRTRTMTFDEGDASGWDECLPSVAACVLENGGAALEIPDHGDLWRVEWERRGAGNREQGTGRNGGAEASVTLTGRCFSLPLELERTLSLSEMEGGWRLNLNYRLKNTGPDPVPWSWAAHPLFVVAKGDRIVLAETIRSMKLEGSGGGRLGKGGDTVAWPIARLSDGGAADLSVAEAEDSGIGDKLFAGPLKADENWCILERPSAGIRIRVRFDSSATPYLGLWICYGAWPEKAGPKQVCVAMEPTTAPVDSLAEQGSWSRLIAPGASFSWPMEVNIELIER